MEVRNMFTVEELAVKIASGGWYFLAGEEALLRRLPKGNWIGGTTPYFMTEAGGTQACDRIYALRLPDLVTRAEIKTYDSDTLARIYEDAPANGFSLIIIPGGSSTHLAFALNAPQYEGFAVSPLAGWIAGVPLPELGKRAPLVFDGLSGAAADGAVVLHAVLPKGFMAEIGIVNIFEPSDGDSLAFPASGFEATEVMVNGTVRNFSEYLAEKGLDTKLPLVADYGGAMINVSFQAVDRAAGKVSFFAPVFEGVEYRHAKPVGEYLDAFIAHKPAGVEERLTFSCNCILNYLYAGLEGKRTAGFSGPITFGEVAYQLLNQTAVYLEISRTNLAERLRRETALYRKYRILDTLMDTIPSPVYHVDAAGRLKSCNKAFEELAGRPREELLGRPACGVFPPETAGVCADRDAELLRSPGRHNYELDVPDGEGGRRHLIIYRASFADPGGRVAGLIGVITDMTEQKRAAERLAAANEDLRKAQARLMESEKLSAVGRLAAGMAHEMNNPLGVILGFAQALLKREGGGPSLPLKSIERETLRCRELVKELLLLSGAAWDGKPGLMDVNEAVRGALSMMLDGKMPPGVVCERGLAPGLPKAAAASEQVQKALLGILRNALDAMPGGGTLTVKTEAPAARPGYVEITVSDTGAGIPAAVRPRIFEPFFTTKGVGKGTGLGLSVAYEIIKKFNGGIEVESVEGEGTKFTVFLPFRPD